MSIVYTPYTSSRLLNGKEFFDTACWRKIVNQCLTIIVRFLINIVNLCLANIVNLCLTTIVKFVKHNFTHRPFGVWDLLMWVVPIQDNVSLNHNPLFQGKTLWFQSCRLSTWVYSFFMFKGIYVFIYLWLHLIIFFFSLPTYPWWGSSHFIVLNLRFLI